MTYITHLEVKATEEPQYFAVQAAGRRALCLMIAPVGAWFAWEIDRDQRAVEIVVQLVRHYTGSDLASIPTHAVHQGVVEFDERSYHVFWWYT